MPVVKRQWILLGLSLPIPIQAIVILKPFVIVLRPFLKTSLRTAKLVELPIPIFHVLGPWWLVRRLWLWLRLWLWRC